MGKFTQALDFIDIFLLGALGIFGLFILLTINQALFWQQLVSLCLAAVIVLVISRLHGSLLWWFAPYGYGLGIILLIISYFGPSIRGARRWIFIGSTQVQTSELAKPLFLLAFTWFLVRFPPKTARNAVIHFTLFLLPGVLIFRQPDLGTALVYMLSWLAMMVAGGFPVRTLIIGCIAGSMLMPAVWFGLHDYQQARIVNFLEPSRDPAGSGYNALQAMITVGSGQLFGRGLGRGTQSHLRFLPEYHTDFIFATLVEELGIVGGIILLALYFFLLMRILLPFLMGKVQSITPFVFSIGLFMMMLIQVTINTGMNMGILPITGITLPLVSYGGNSIISIATGWAFMWTLRRDSDTYEVAVRV